MAKDAEHFLKCLSAILDFFVESSLFRSVPQFFGQFVLLITNFLRSLYILEIRPLFDVWLVKILSHSVACCFVLLNVSFALQKPQSLEIPFTNCCSQCLCYWGYI